MNARRSRTAGLLRALALGSGLLGANAVTAGDDPSPGPAAAVACDSQLKAPKLLLTSAAVIPDAIWTQKEGWSAEVRFRLDEAGAPYAVFATVTGDHGDTKLREQLTAETLQRYKFCLPGDFSTSTDWLATVRFLYRHVVTKSQQQGEMYIQMFMPSYSRSDLSERRAGTVWVAATFGQDGRPTRLHVTRSSGDPVLDDKTIDAVSTYQLAFHDSTVKLFPMTLEHPFDYAIR